MGLVDPGYWHFVSKVLFCLDGNALPFVDKCCHLGHMLSSCLDDKQDILSRRASMCGKVKNILCHFNKCDPLVRLKLMRSYCSDLYGSVLWDMSHSSVDNVCIAWRKGLRRALGLPWRIRPCWRLLLAHYQLSMSCCVGQLCLCLSV